MVALGSAIRLRVTDLPARSRTGLRSTPGLLSAAASSIRNSIWVPPPRVSHHQLDVVVLVVPEPQPGLLAAPIPAGGSSRVASIRVTWLGASIPTARRCRWEFAVLEGDAGRGRYLELPGAVSSNRLAGM